MTQFAGGADRSARILIVDDELRNRQLLEAMLSPEGFHLVSAESGDEALAEIRRQPPDVILLDVMMPGMDGFEVTRRIKNTPATRNIPIIILSALDTRRRTDGRAPGRRRGFPHEARESCRATRARAEPVAPQGLQPRCLEDEVGLRTADLVESERLYRSTFDAAPRRDRARGPRRAVVDDQSATVRAPGIFARDATRHWRSRRFIQAEDAAGDADALRQMAAGTMDRHVIEGTPYRRRDGSVMWARVQHVRPSRRARSAPAHRHDHRGHHGATGARGSACR